MAAQRTDTTLTHGDRTLVDWEIENSRTGHLDFSVQPFDRDGLKGASYDIHAGSLVYMVLPGTNGVTFRGPEPITGPGQPAGSRDGTTQGFRLEPGQSVVVRSKEIIKLPANMYGRLTLRVAWALRGLAYHGGIIDPGFWGHLFIALSNETDVVIEIPVEGEHIGKENALATMQFVELSQPAREPLRYDHPVIELPPDRSPRPPKGDIYNLVRLTEKVNEQDKVLADLITELAQYRGHTDSVMQIVQLGFFALVAGLAAALGGVAFQSAKSSGGVPAITLAVAASLLFVVAGVIGDRLFARSYAGTRYQARRP